MLILITAKPGSFKSAKAATMAIKYLKEGRPVYTNIDQFDYEGAKPLPENNDWRDTPDGSVVIYDEAQQFDFLQYKGREKLSSDERVKALEVHRHTGHDIILVTQSPSFLHNHVLSLVGSHYHLHRAYGRAFADVFLWRYAITMPDSTGAKNKAESHEKFKPDSKIFEKYKSTTLDTHKLKIPPIYFKLGGFLLAVLALIGFMVFGSDNPYLSASKIKENADIASGKKQAEQPLVGSQAASASISSPGAAPDLSVECRKGVNIEKPECVKWFDDLSKNGSSVTSSGQVVQTVSYNPNKPYDFEYQPQVQPTDFPRMSGVVKLSSGRLMAIDQQGNYMPQISSNDCQRWLDGYRPFDYFAQKQTQQVVQSDQQNQQQVQPQIQQQTPQNEVSI